MFGGFSRFRGGYGGTPSYGDFLRNKIRIDEFGPTPGQMAHQYLSKYGTGGGGRSMLDDYNRLNPDWWMNLQPWTAPRPVKTNFRKAGIVDSPSWLKKLYGPGGTGYGYNFRKPNAGLQAGAGLPGMRGGQSPRLGGSTPAVRFF